jgi:hypothetical protein
MDDLFIVISEMWWQRKWRRRFVAERNNLSRALPSRTDVQIYFTLLADWFFLIRSGLIWASGVPLSS